MKLTTKGRIKLFCGSSKVSEHVLAEEAYESAYRHALANGPGKYVVQYPDREIDLSALSRVVLLSAPTVTTTVISSSRIDLSWTAVVGAASYRVYRNGVLVDSPTAASSSNTGLSASTLYSFRVSTVDASGLEGPQGAAVSATTQATPDTTAPTSPTITATTVSSSSQSIALTTAATDAGSGVATYQLQRATNSAFTANLTTTTGITAAQFPLSITGLSASTTYYYRCRAVDNSSNVGAYSATSSATTSAASSFLFHDNFASGDRTHTENGIGWIGSHNTSIQPFPSASGYALRFRNNDPDGDGIPGGTGSSHGEQRFALDLADPNELYEELWIKWILFVPSNYAHVSDGGSSNNKFIRLWSGNKADNNGGYQQYYIKLGYSTNPDSSIVGASDLINEKGIMRPDGSVSGVGTFDAPGINQVIVPADYGNTIEFVFHVKIDTLGDPTGRPIPTGGNGVMQLWKNGVLIDNHTTMQMRPGMGTNGYNRGYFLGATNSDLGNPPGSEVVDMYITEVWFAASNVFGVS